MILVIIFLSLGIMSGFMAGLFGIGGSMIMVPFLVPLFDHMGLFGTASIKFAIASAMAVVCFTSLSSIRAHHGRGAIDWRVSAIFTLGILPGGLLASLGAFGFLHASWLYFLFTGLMLLSGVQMWRGHKVKNQPTKKPARPAKPFRPGDSFKLLPARPWLVAFGVAVGFLSGLVGAGGGFLMVPFQTHFGIPVNRAVANSASTGFPIAIINTLGFLLGDGGGAGGGHAVGFVYWPAVFTIATTSVLLAPLGARLAHSLPLPTLRRIFAVFLFVMAGYMGWRGFTL